MKPESASTQILFRKPLTAHLRGLEGGYTTPLEAYYPALLPNKQTPWLTYLPDGYSLLLTCLYEHAEFLFICLLLNVREYTWEMGIQRGIT